MNLVLPNYLLIINSLIKIVSGSSYQVSYTHTAVILFIYGGTMYLWLLYSYNPLMSLLSL